MSGAVVGVGAGFVVVGAVVAAGAVVVVSGVVEPVGAVVGVVGVVEVDVGAGIVVGAVLDVAGSVVVVDDGTSVVVVVGHGPPHDGWRASVPPPIESTTSAPAASAAMVLRNMVPLMGWFGGAETVERATGDRRELVAVAPVEGENPDREERARDHPHGCERHEEGWERAHGVVACSIA